jgi:ABC-type multidrug transport system permease subunit
MLAGLGAAFAKDLRLLARDRVGLVFLTLAPIVVITVAGLSLANLYGATPHGASAPVLPIVDDDADWIGRAVRERLLDEPSVRARAVGTAAEARALVRAGAASAALVVPHGTSAAVVAGQPAALELLTDPVRTVDVAWVRALAQEVRHALETAALERAQQELDAARGDADDARARLTAATTELRARITTLHDRVAAASARAETARRELAGAIAERQAAARARIVAEVVPLRRFLAELEAARAAFARWAADVRERAGRFADRFPPPPEPPAVPPELAALAAGDPAALAARLVPADGGLPALPALPSFDVPAVPSVELPAPPAGRLPGSLAIVETSITGAPLRFNTFDQNVPGFSVTFLLLGVLLGVSLGLLDERDWGTLERMRATPTPLAVLLIAKLGARFAVGIVQMLLLFVVGWAVFGVSLGPEPWALALPTAGIVFAGTAFGLVVAGTTRSREAVLPIGSIAILTMAAVGGCWWPLDLEPEWMRRAALAFPTTWAMQAYNDLMIRRQTGGAVLHETAVLFAYGALYLALGLFLFRRVRASRR